MLTVLYNSINEYPASQRGRIQPMKPIRHREILIRGEYDGIDATGKKTKLPRFDRANFIPGANLNFPEATWAKLAAMAEVKQMVRAQSLIPLYPVNEVGDDARETLLAYSIEDAVLIVQNIWSKAKLTNLKATETRIDVLNAIDDQLKHPDVNQTEG